MRCAALLQAAVLVVSVCSAVCQRCESGCHPPECSCPRFYYPMDKKEIPQMVFFAFDDAVTDRLSELYDHVFPVSRVNPNNCSVRYTLFVSNPYTDYSEVKKFYDRGVEIGVTTFLRNSHPNTTSFIRDATQQRENIARYARIPLKEIVGWRSPFLKTIGDPQPVLLNELDYDYDISLTFTRYHHVDPNPWPFTMEHGWPYPCEITPCPTNVKVPGFWEVPINAMIGPYDKEPCVYVDGCATRPRNAEDTFNYLWDNFMANYNGSRSPLGLNLHPGWFLFDQNLQGTIRFLDELAKLKDVYVLTVQQVLAWMKRPTPLHYIHKLPAWGCQHDAVKAGREEDLTSS